MKRRAALGSFVFLILAPGMVAGFGPWLITKWAAHDWTFPVRAAAAVILATGVLTLLHAFLRFVVEGTGTPAPVAPTQRLVVGGAYRYVRNPMYLAVGGVILGQALLLGQSVLLAWLACFALAVEAFVRLYEEPALTNRYGDDYRDYCSSVPRW